MANLPNYQINRFSIGPAVIYMANWQPGILPVKPGDPGTDVGAVRPGSTFTTSRDKVEVYQGFPKSLVAQFASSEAATLKLTTIEWNLKNLQNALAGGILSESGEITTSDVQGAYESSGDEYYLYSDTGLSTSLTSSATGSVTGYVAGPIATRFIGANYTVDTANFWPMKSGTSVTALNALEKNNFILSFTCTVGTNDYAVYCVDEFDQNSGTGRLVQVAAVQIGTGPVNIQFVQEMTSYVDYRAGAGYAKVVIDIGSSFTFGDGTTATKFRTAYWLREPALGEVLDFGGEVDFKDVAILVKHDTPKGRNVKVYIWRAQGDGSIEVNFADGDVHEFPMTFNAMVPFDPCTGQVTDWWGNALPSGKQLFKIVVGPPADTTC